MGQTILVERHVVVAKLLVVLLMVEVVGETMERRLWGVMG